MPALRRPLALVVATLPLSWAARSLGEAPAAAMSQLELPFACGAEAVVSQGHGTFSHVGVDRWAWDFRVPEGTPVVAAAEGVVRLARSDSVRGGCDRSFGKDANYVVLSHADGLETQYLHFSRVFVEVGERVQAGTLLGEVGRTGFSCGAHLHFQVQRAEGAGWALQSVPARFRGLGDPELDEVVVSENCALSRPSAPLHAAARPAPAPREPSRL